MKNLTLFVVAIAILSACNNAPQGKKVKTEDAKEVKATSSASDFVLNTEASKIAWVGTKPSGQHNGELNFKSGSLKVENGELVGGSFVADLTSIEVLDLEKGGDMYNKLVGHLKSDDFFDVEKFPTAEFEITEVKKLADTEAVDGIVPTHIVTGNLKIKDITKSISFDAAITVNDASVSASSVSFVIDRTEWGIKFKSKKFFSELKDNFISDNFSLTISLEAKK